MLLGATPGVTPPAPRLDRRVLGDPSEKRKAGPDGRPHLRVCAHDVLSHRNVLRRATGASCGVQPARPAACNRHVLRRATGTSCGVQPARLAARNRRILPRATGTSCGVQPARLAARNRRVLRRATGASCGAQPARLAARNRRVLRRATGASLGAQPARLAAYKRQVPAACNLRRAAHFDTRKSARYRASNHNPSPLVSAAGKACDLAKC